MDLNDLIKYLNNITIISNVEILQNNLYKGKEYLYLVNCYLVNFDQPVSIVIGVPVNWAVELVDIYIDEYKKLPFIPHVDNKGKICLYALEGVLIDKDLHGIVFQSLKQAEKIISDGLIKANLTDFVDEFELYWDQLPNVKISKINVDNSNEVIKISYAMKTSQKRKENEDYAKYRQRIKDAILYITEKSSDLNKYGIENAEIKNGLFINVVMNEFLYPPDFRQPISIKYIEYLLSNVNTKKLKRKVKKLKQEKLFVFKIQQPNGVSSSFGFFLRGCHLSFENGKCTVNTSTKSDIIPISTMRIDKRYLMSRTDEVGNLLQNKRVLLIGCGSLGGYIANELVKSGVENMMLVDTDYLHEENIFRHLLGLEYTEQYKCVALKAYLDKNIPNLNINTRCENVENLVREESINLKSYDMIISAVGSHNVNRWLNEHIMLNKIEVPVIYAWNEVLGIGNHIAYIKYGNNGCYDCFIGRDECTSEIYDRTSYCYPGQQTIIKVLGCGNAFIPYGSTISLKTACLCLDTVKKVFENRFSDNVIISSKGDDYYFKAADLRVSNKYLKQKNDTVEYTGIQFLNKMCEVCGIKNGV